MSCNLNFGLVGHAVYDPDNQEWLFGRRPGRRCIVGLLGSHRLSHPAIVQHNAVAGTGRVPAMADLRKSARALVRREPELASVLPLLPQWAIPSIAVNAAVGEYDPFVGGLFSLGRTTDAASRTRVDLAATATGEAGNILRITSLPHELHGWRADKSIWLKVPVLGESDAYWADEGAPIMQLCFAEGDSRSQFLAVRFPARTILFSPRLHPQGETRHWSRFYDLPASPLDPNPIVSLPIDQTGGASHADITFNPWYQHQMGVIDHKGNWGVWDVEGGRGAKRSYSAACTNGGMISRPVPSDRENDEPRQQDGWAKILWIGDVNTVLVCNRRKIEIFDTRGQMGSPTPLKSPDVTPSRSSDWILDVKRRCGNSHHFYVLTSSRLLLLEVTCLDRAEREGYAESGATVLLSWQHLRSPDDITLQLTSAVEPADGK